MAYTLNDNLKRWAEQYETAEFIQSDPVQIPHRYDSRVNIEISAFVTAWIAWGNRKQIIKKADFIDREIFHGAPYHYIVGTDTQGTAPEWRQYKTAPKVFTERLRLPISTTFASVCTMFILIGKVWRRQ